MENIKPEDLGFMIFGVAFIIFSGAMWIYHAIKEKREEKK